MLFALNKTNVTRTNRWSNFRCFGENFCRLVDVSQPLAPLVRGASVELVHLRPQLVVAAVDQVEGLPVSGHRSDDHCAELDNRTQLFIDITGVEFE